MRFGARFLLFGRLLRMRAKKKPVQNHIISHGLVYCECNALH